PDALSLLQIKTDSAQHRPPLIPLFHIFDFSQCHQRLIPLPAPKSRAPHATTSRLPHHLPQFCILTYAFCIPCAEGLTSARQVPCRVAAAARWPSGASVSRTNSANAAPCRVPSQESHRFWPARPDLSPPAGRPGGTNPSGASYVVQASNSPHNPVRFP